MGLPPSYFSLQDRRWPLWIVLCLILAMATPAYSQSGSEQTRSNSATEAGPIDAAKLLEQSEDILARIKAVQLRDSEDEWDEFEEEVANWTPGKVDYFRDPEVSQRVVADVEGARRRLQKEVEFWARGSSNFAEVDELNKAVAEAIVIAEISGLDVAQLTTIHNATKEVIRDAEFEIVGRPPPNEDTDWGTYFKGLFRYALGMERQIEAYRAKLMEYRLGLYKKTTVAYIRALISTYDEPPACGLDVGAIGKTEVDGIAVGALGCPDPVIDNLRAYGDAIRTIQSADVDVALSQVEQLVKQQQLVADVLMIVPLVGEAIDFYQVTSGETLAGRTLSVGERAFISIFVTIPLVGPRAAPYVKKYLGQAIRRSPRVAIYLYEFTMVLQGHMRSVEDMLAGAGGIAPARVSNWVAREWGTTLDGLRKMQEHLAIYYLPSGEMSMSLSRELAERSLGGRARVLATIQQRNLMNKALRDVATDRIWMLDAPPEILRRAREASDELMSRILLRSMPASQTEIIARSGIVDSHALALLEVASRRNELLLMRPVNPHAGTLMETLGAGTKNMGIKSKSASRGVIAGALPVDQSLNKVGSELDDLYQRKLAGTLAPDEAANFSRRVQELEEGLAKGEKAVAKCLDDPNCAKAATFKVKLAGEERVVMSVKVDVVVDGKTVQKTVMVIPDGNRLLDPSTGKVLDITPVSAPRPVRVLVDPRTGKILTADYDVLNFGQKGRHSSPTFNKNTGFITESQQRTIREANEAVRRRGYKGGDVIHHGAEQNFLLSPGVDYPITAIDGGARRIFQIDACDANCMARWCEVAKACNPVDLCSRLRKPGCIAIDKDRLLKDYFHSRRLKSYNLDPNPVWNWGNYNGEGGWLPLREF